MTQAAAQRQMFLVKRAYTTPDMGPYGGGNTAYRYIATEEPKCGETLYHGDFQKRTDYGDQKYDDPVDYYVPVDPEQVSTSTYECEKGQSSGGVTRF